MVRPRPSISLIVPFAGPGAELDRLICALEQVQRQAGDEVIIADNRPSPGSPAPAVPPELRICSAPEISSPGYARNAGARHAAGEWLVFIDADSRPTPGLLDAYFERMPDHRTAILAGGVHDVCDGDSTIGRYYVARAKMSQTVTLRRHGLPYAQTANCAVRRSAFECAGGFDPGARAGEDADLCFRLMRAGWKLEERPTAYVEHRSRTGIRAWLSQQLRHGQGAAWLDRRWPGEFPSPGPLALGARTGRLLLQALLWLARGQTENALFTLMDLAGSLAFDLGRLVPNSAKVRVAE
jgi:GT2 family glycosyltransferase